MRSSSSCVMLESNSHPPCVMLSPVLSLVLSVAKEQPRSGEASLCIGCLYRFLARLGMTGSVLSVMLSPVLSLVLSEAKEQRRSGEGTAKEGPRSGEASLSIGRIRMNCA